MSDHCVHSCKGLCSALELAEKRERDTMEEYRQFAATCDYPDVRSLLEELIGHREEGLRLLQATRELLSGRFDTLDDITDSFA